MELNINKEKFEVFLEVAREINKSFNIILVLYGSLGLSRVIGEFGKANDIDVLVPKRFLKEKWNKLIGFMEKDLGQADKLREDIRKETEEMLNVFKNKEIIMNEEGNVGVRVKEEK